MEFVGVIFAELDVIAGCGGVWGASGLAFDVVDAAAGEVASIGGLEALPASFELCFEVVVVLFTFVVDVLVGLSPGGADAFVDFWRMVAFLAGSALSVAFVSDTTFFGLPLFFTASDDIVTMLQMDNSGNKNLC